MELVASSRAHSIEYSKLTLNKGAESLELTFANHLSPPHFQSQLMLTQILLSKILPRIQLHLQIRTRLQQQNKYTFLSTVQEPC